jgi:hypothetical protein
MNEFDLPQNKYNLFFRLVEVRDAAFILSLRSDAKLSRYISDTSSELNDQINWIQAYKEREKLNQEFYVLCLSGDRKIKLGLNRVYNIKDASFEIGSWLFKRDASNNAAILGDLFCRSLMFDSLDFEKCVFEVRKDNKSVIRYHKMFSPIFVDEDALNYYYELSKEKFEKTKNILIKKLGHD